jgi:cytochrome P450
VVDQRIPALAGPPLVGHLVALRRDPVALLERVARACGDVGRFRVGPREVVLVTAAEPAREVLVDRAASFEKGPVVRRFARAVLGDGLIACENAVHRSRRRLVAPAFAPRLVERYAEAMVEAAERIQRGWRDGDTIDVAAEMARLALAVVGRTLFSIDLLDAAPGLRGDFEAVMRYVHARIEHPLRLPLAVPTAANREVRRALARLDNLLFTLVAERRARGGGGDGGDLLDALVRARDETEGGRALSDRQLRDEAMNLLLAGHETSASALAWALYLLARDGASARRLEAEADALAGPPRSDDLPRLAFAGRAFQEALRLYPPVHSLGRQAREPVTIGGYRLGSGAVVVVSPLLMHRRADYFPEPDAFHADRFAGDGVRRAAYLPFGAGPRGCLGGGFATVEAQLVLATLARRVRFEWTLPAEPRPELLVTLRPRGGLPMRVRRR